MGSMLKLGDLLDLDLLQKHTKDGYVSDRKHPRFPLGILNYSHACTFDSAWDNVTTQTRGLIYNTETQEIVARPWRKWWNFADPRHPETLEANLPAATPEITLKLDGSLCIIIPPQPVTDNEWVLATRGSFQSEQAQWATKWWAERGRGLWVTGFTYLAEVCYKDNPTQVVESADGITLLSVIETASGEECGALVVEKAAAVVGIPAVTLFTKSLGECVGDSGKYKGTEREGYVLSWHTNCGPSLKVKVKLEDYVRLARLYQHCSPKTIWEVLRDGGNIATLVENTPAPFQRWANSVQGDLTAHYDRLRQVVFSLVVEVGEALGTLPPPEQVKADREVRKSVALAIQRVAPKSHLSAVFASILGDRKTLDKWIWKTIQPFGNAYRRGDTENA